MVLVIEGVPRAGKREEFPSLGVGRWESSCWSTYLEPMRGRFKLIFLMLTRYFSVYKKS